LLDLGLEAELEGDVGNAVVVVVDLHFVEDAGVEREVIRSVRGLQKWIYIEDEDHPVGMLGTDEGKPIGDVGLLVQGGDGRFAMTGRDPSGAAIPGAGSR
jgi:hypothetical protein